MPRKVGHPPSMGVGEILLALELQSFGIKGAVIAHHLGVSERQMYRHLAKYRKEVNMAAKKPTIPSGPQLVMVYGSLREGLHNHHLLKDSESIAHVTIPTGYRMVSLGGFPAVLRATPDRETPIVAEIYKVSPQTLLVLDSLEGHPDWYKREKVVTEHGNAWIYVMPPGGYEDNRPVPEGDWLDYYTAARKTL